MTVILLSGAGLLVRTLLALNRADSGFDMHDVLTMEVALPAARYSPSAGCSSIARHWLPCAALPGVTGRRRPTASP